MTAGEHALLLLRRGLHQRCPVCGFAFEREPGYYTGAMAVNLVVSELLIVIIAVPLAASQVVSVVYLIILGCTIPILLPIIFYRPSKSLWMSFDHFIHPANKDQVCDHIVIINNK